MTQYIPTFKALQNDLVTLSPLEVSDFENLYLVAADPKIWEQHPNPNRYQREDFGTFFKGAIESISSYLVKDSKSGAIIGSTRYYNYKPENSCVNIGYTFLDRAHWGGTYNLSMKRLMIDNAFEVVDTVKFHIGACNVRSQMAITRLGATKVGEETITYYGERAQPNFIYQIEKRLWIKI